jgi:hypothetical protein
LVDLDSQGRLAVASADDDEHALAAMFHAQKLPVREPVKQTPESLVSRQRRYPSA